MIRSAVLAAAFVLLVALSACSSRPERTRAIALAPLYSPNAEPLNGGTLGYPSCPQAIASWFARTDASRDGILDHTEFMADARVQFDRMDLNHDGVITSSTLSAYRAPYQPGPPPRQRTTAGDGDTPADQGRRPHPGQRPGPSGGGGAMAIMPADIPDPVMSADTHARFKVTWDDFRIQAESIYGEMDQRQDGKVTLADVVAWTCRPPRWLDPTTE